MRWAARREVPWNGLDFGSGKERTQLRIAVTGEELTQIFPRQPSRRISPQQPLDRVRDFGGPAAVADRTRDGLILAHGTANAEVVRIHHLATHFYLLALNSDVSDPVL